LNTLLNERDYSQLKKYLSGETLSPKDAILAMCNTCCCNYADGTVSCELYACPLFQFMPFKDKPQSERSG